MMTKWWCSRCHAAGKFNDPESVYEAIEIMRSAHDAFDIGWRNGCTFDVLRIHVETFRGFLVPAKFKHQGAA